MSKEMIVSVNGREKKIAILENGKVTEFYIERGEENAGVVGNVYKGRVMRVLPGMQSAFVDIGLERDAFLYVTDFFDEEEEIERIVMEKGKKTSPEDAKREANEQIERSRIEREKQMESVQELAEPMSATAERLEDMPAVESVTDEPARMDEQPEEISRPERGKRGRGRGRKDSDQDIRTESATPIFEVEFDNSGFERISDSEDSDTGDLFKDAYVQEAIVDRVRAIEFDMESTAVAEVGSLLPEVTGDLGGFERIADEDDDTPATAKPRGRAKAKSDAEEKAPAKAKKPAKRPAAKGKFAKPKAKKSTKDDAVEDAEASHKESENKAEMAVRCGGRGRRKPKSEGEEGLDGGPESQESIETAPQEIEPVLVEQIRDEPAADGPRAETEAPQQREQTDDRPRGRDNRDTRGRRGGRGRNDRPSDDRPSGDRPGGDRPSGERPSDDRPRDRPMGDRPSNDRPNRDRPSGDRPSGDRKRFDRNDRGDRGSRPPQPTISDLLKEGQEILVQIAKEPIAKKGARITSHIALPGRFLVYMPTIEHLGVSRKIESSSERSRLRTLIQRIRQDAEIPSGGFIVRTAGIGISEEDLRNDAKYLVRTWADSRKIRRRKDRRRWSIRTSISCSEFCATNFRMISRRSASIARRNTSARSNSSTGSSRGWSSASSSTPATSRSSNITACRKRSIRLSSPASG